MPFAVYFSNKANKFLKKCDPKLKARITELVKVLEEKPVPASDYDVLKVEGQESRYRIRLSSHRLVYEVDWKLNEIDILKIEKRSETTYA